MIVEICALSNPFRATPRQRKDLHLLYLLFCPANRGARSTGGHAGEFK